MLSNFIGEETFKDGIKNYLKSKYVIKNNFTLKYKQYFWL